MPALPSVTVVILNWNGKKWLEQFLPFVANTQYKAFSILIVDNNSSDDSVSFIRENYPNIQLIILDQNYGFTGGNNRALPHIQTPYFVLLNSDVEVDPGWLGPLVDRMEKDESIASIQPKILSWTHKSHFEYAGAAGGYIDSLGYPFCRGRIFDTLEEDNGQYEQAAEIFWASGACCLIRTAVVKQIGLFEESFFAHMEEIDFCWRAQSAGFRIWYEPRSVVFHVGGGTLPQGNPFKIYLNVRNSLAMLHSNLPAGKVFGTILLRLILDGVWGIKALVAGDAKTLPAILKAHFAYYKKLSYWKKRRKEIRKTASASFEGKGLYQGSLVWTYFIRRKKYWSEIMGNSLKNR